LLMRLSRSIWIAFFVKYEGVSFKQKDKLSVA
jgi:hypothetical protein